MRQSAIITLPIAYSVHGHISVILEASSKRPDDFFFDRKETK